MSNLFGFYSRFAVSTFRKRKLRSLLTMLGIFIGIAAIVSLISLGQGLQTAIATQFQALGTDRIIIQPKAAIFAPPGQLSVTQLSEADLDRIEDVPGVARVASRLLKNAKIEYNDQVKFHLVASMPNEADGRRLVEESLRLTAAKGRLIQGGDRKKVVVGNSFLDKNLFGRAIKTGDTILVNDETFKVVGVLEKLGNPGFDDAVLIPERAMQELYNVPGEVSAIIAQSAPGVAPEVVGDRISRRLRTFRDVEEGKEDFTVQTTGELLDAFENILNVVTAVLVGIAFISLLVGGIGITNTMYTSVIERTNDIGVMKAIGAKNKDVLFIFMLESGILGLVGGTVGILIGYGFGKIVEFAAGQALGPGLIQAAFPPYLIIGALGFSLIVGGIAGTLPAIQASRLNPVDAMRH